MGLSLSLSSFPPQSAPNPCDRETDFSRNDRAGGPPPKKERKERRAIYEPSSRFPSRHLPPIGKAHDVGTICGPLPTLNPNYFSFFYYRPFFFW
jgi:hypothetical protein